MSNCNDIDAILNRNGTDQENRLVKALDPKGFKLQDFDIEDWILFAYNFAKHVQYYHTNDDTIPHADWQALFNHFNISTTDVPFRTSRAYGTLKTEVASELNALKADSKLTPHLTLFVCFLRLLEQTQERFNALTQRHLEYYYTEVLQLNRKAPIADQAHIIFELAKKSVEERIEAATELNANKDAAGGQRIYTTDEELIVNKAQVSTFKSVYNSINQKEIKASAVSNTLDGLEEPLPETAPYWYPFGYTSEEKNYTELANAEIGFAVASPLLSLQEGLRTVIVTIQFDDPSQTDPALEKIDIKQFIEAVTVYGSGEEAWFGPMKILESVIIKTGEGKSVKYTSELTKNEARLVVQLDNDQDALVNYNPEFLLEGYATTFPVLRFQLNTDENVGGHSILRALVNRIVNKISIKVDVRGAKSLTVENDTGKLKTTKPFYPFTPQPLKKSNFYIDYPEVFSKQWSHININMLWKNTPEDFKVWYQAYLKNHRIGTKRGTYLTAVTGTIASSNLIVSGADHFKAEKAIKHKEQWSESSDLQKLFTIKPKKNDTDTDVVYECNVTLTNDAYTIDKTGPVRLSLEQTFLHELFPRLYALSITDDNALIPNEPYTPIIEEISIDYIAEEHRVVTEQAIDDEGKTVIAQVNTIEAYDAERIKLFHIHPFGQCEEHNHVKLTQYLKGIKDTYDKTVIQTHLVPKYCDGGTLFIGLDQAEVQQNVSLLIQVLEGSENPLRPTFESHEKVQWAVLCDNKWKGIQDDIISNDTDNFLKSGIIQFPIPREATKTNTQLPAGLIWVRARMHRSFDAVCKMINMHTQAVVATFNNQDNDVAHLNDGLPAGTIKKLINRIPQVKGVAQPYNSFGGFPEEDDMDFYRRVSERLRHKNRAITLWDYEHLVLQEFPEIYKVKCLNHTKDNPKPGYKAPGHVTLVVIPDIVNKNVFDIYQPRVSKATINKVIDFINELNGMLVTTEVINPEYEEIHVSLQVSFFKGYDESFYMKQLEQDIIRFLSPWAFDDTKKIAFGVTLHRSVLVDYLEKLPYVDYLQNVTIGKKLPNGTIQNATSLAPANPKSILVSAKNHNISTVLTTCQGNKPATEIICQA